MPLVGARAGELIAEGQLIYNWETLPSKVAQLVHPPPDPIEAIGEAHLALAGKPLHVHAWPGAGQPLSTAHPPVTHTG